ncbi:hypothetical protein [Halocalculus aciditolerans]|uniref:Uncharacterized protein n=1 Tax=Halocalculus aciditolerans TaxID=1383812 RepID=A0A830FK91_9EURY|nr:hypothetical protein [Halocalculus aciditolerans]GGL64186.1 hypothetical protein GCM10009039_22550 [Halocalculus aciditolerans]
MPEALVKGETHSSKKDKQALLNLDFTEYDAVFREGYDKDYFQRDIDSLYALFAIGHLVYGATYSRLYHSGDEFKRQAKRQGLPVHDRIDAAVYETYEMVPRWQRGGLFLISPLFAGLILGFVVQPVDWVLSRVAPGILGELAFAGVVLTLLCFGFVWALAYFLLIENRAMYERDEVMAREIVQIVETNGYESVLISCGGNHRSGISSYLREERWEVKEEATDSLLGKLLHFLSIKRLRQKWSDQ